MSSVLGREVVSADGLRFVDYGADGAMAWGGHEADLERWFAAGWRECLSSCSFFVDVGAHVGRYAVRAAARGVWAMAFEPDPEMAALLSANLALNALGALVLPFALGESFGRVGFARPDPSPLNEWRPSGGHGRLVPGDASGGVALASPLDDVMRRFGRPPVGFVKVDVEGGEVEVLEGARETLTRWRPAVLVECHDALVGRPLEERVIEILRDVIGGGARRVATSRPSTYVAAGFEGVI